MANEADVANVPIEFEYKGKTYKIARLLNFMMEQAFADWVFANAVRYLERQQALFMGTEGEMGVSPDQGQAMLNHLAEQSAMGEFDWGSRIVEAKRKNSWEGIKYSMMLRFKAHHPEVGLKMINEIFKDEKERERLYAALRPQKSGGDENESEKTPSVPPVPEGQPSA